ncbi:hypothetical protein GC197_12105 [bacterium]|nr:hypothetical protein [bacterium]
MLRLIACLSLVLLVGCLKPIELEEPEKKPASEAQPTSANPASTNPAAAQPAEAAPGQSMPSEPAAETPAEPAKPKKGVIHQTTDVVVDAKEWLQKPGIEARDGKIEGVDPFSQSASGYFTLAAKASTLGMQQQIQHYKALNGKNPSYKEFAQMMRDNRIEFAKLRWYEIYGYNEDTGNILVLVDTVAKEEGP